VNFPFLSGSWLRFSTRKFQIGKGLQHPGRPSPGAPTRKLSGGHLRHAVRSEDPS
jgi:hypothetical protein